ncbi:MAG: hypothetical protein IH598_17810 [Bacteroidales bacterium]|nr:hypothetical protein [Bacteroidales bacterium]
MKKNKRLMIATLSGLLFGFICFGFASGGPEPLPMPVAVQIIISRTLIGFALGITSLTFGHWVIRGLLFGLLFSLPLAFSGLMSPASPEFTPLMMFYSSVIMGMIYGLLIELITTKLFKANV